jgi:hypothetical protein
LRNFIGELVGDYALDENWTAAGRCREDRFSSLWYHSEKLSQERNPRRENIRLLAFCLALQVSRAPQERATRREQAPALSKSEETLKE